MDTSTNPPDAKALLRRRVLASRARMSEADRRRAASRLLEHGFAAWRSHTVVAAYAAVGNEPATGPLIEALANNGATVLLPVVVGERLDWAAYDGVGSLRPGRLGLLEPTGPRVGGDALGSVQVVIVPALAVDGEGRRLGRGGGYYDRALAGTAVPVAAVVYDEEIVTEVPVEPHDHRVDAVLRPSGLLVLSGGG